MRSKSITSQEALNRLELYCSRGEYCRYELSEKLRRWGIMPAEAEKILNSLEERRFLDDRRYAAAYVRDKLIYNRWGRMKLSLGLRAKRVDTSIIEEALDEIDPEEYLQTARDFLISRARTIKEGFTYEGRTRLYRTGLSRGFESAVVASIVKDRSTWPDSNDED